MPSPFPGMDPYLENPELWGEVHNRSIVAIADAIAPSLRPKYRVAIAQRTYLTERLRLFAAIASIPGCVACVYLQN